MSESVKEISSKESLFKSAGAGGTSVVAGNAEYLDNVKRPLMFAAEQAIGCANILNNYVKIKPVNALADAKSLREAT